MDVICADHPTVVHTVVDKVVKVVIRREASVPNEGKRFVRCILAQEFVELLYGRFVCLDVQ